MRGLANALWGYTVAHRVGSARPPDGGEPVQAQRVDETFLRIELLKEEDCGSLVCNLMI